MRNNLITITPKLSRFLIVSIIIMVSVILILTIFANLVGWYKLAIILMTITILSILFYNYISNPIKKYDILIELNNIVIWCKNKTELVEIDEMSHIGNFLIIIRIKQAKSIKTLFLFFDSTDIVIFKHLMRQIRWQKTKLN